MCQPERSSTFHWKNDWQLESHTNTLQRHEQHAKVNAIIFTTRSSVFGVRFTFLPWHMSIFMFVRCMGSCVWCAFCRCENQAERRRRMDVGWNWCAHKQCHHSPPHSNDYLLLLFLRCSPIQHFHFLFFSAVPSSSSFICTNGMCLCFPQRAHVWNNYDFITVNVCACAHVNIWVCAGTTWVLQNRFARKIILRTTQILKISSSVAATAFHHGVPLHVLFEFMRQTIFNSLCRLARPLILMLARKQRQLGIIFYGKRNKLML